MKATPTATKSRPLRARRSERGQAMLEYSAITYFLLVGAVAGGWPFFVILLNAVNTYFASIYWMLGQPV